MISAPLCPGIADVDANGRLEIADAVSLLSYLFQRGVMPDPMGAGETAACRAARE